MEGEVEGGREQLVRGSRIHVTTIDTLFSLISFYLSAAFLSPPLSFSRYRENVYFWHGFLLLSSAHEFRSKSRKPEGRGSNDDSITLDSSLYLSLFSDSLLLSGWSLERRSGKTSNGNNKRTAREIVDRDGKEIFFCWGIDRGRYISFISIDRH